MSVEEDSAYAPKASADLDASFTATMAHVRRLGKKEAALVAARQAAEVQVFHVLGSAYRSGEICFRELYRYFLEVRAIRLPGQGTRWSEQVGIDTNEMILRGRWIPNGTEGTWFGNWPIGRDDSAPKDGQCVVYVLFDADNEPCYVGSTAKLRQRMRRHERDNKAFSRWQAYPAGDRESAYRLEDRVLRERLPKLNVKASR